MDMSYKIAVKFNILGKRYHPNKARNEIKVENGLTLSFEQKCRT
jgi:hypothetical protein